MDLYAALEGIVRQIPRGRVAIAADVAKALGDKAAVVSLPYTLERIYRGCRAAGRVVRADGSLIIHGDLEEFRRARPAYSGSRIVDIEELVFRRFRTRYPLRRLRRSQVRMSRRVVLKDDVREPEIVAGVDVSYDGDHAYAAAVAMSVKPLSVVSMATVEMDVEFPYIPGYLAFRESPPMIKALRALQVKPQLVFVDGHGVLHPARFGVASQIGVMLGVPTIGVGKSHLVGQFDSAKLDEVGSVGVKIGGRILGYALRSSSSAKPIFISPGTMVSPRTALRITNGFCLSRIPEPIRLADSIAIEKRWEKSGL